MRYAVFMLFAVWAALPAPPAASQDESAEQAPGEEPARQERPRPGRAQGRGPSWVDVKKMREAMRANDLQQLEELKRSNPAAYEQQKEAIESSDKIERILSDARDKKLSEPEAERMLLPLMREVMKPELGALDEQIASLEKRLALLKRAKRNPDALVRQRVEEMLGKRQPESGDPE